MNYLSVENISKSFGERVLFENLSFGINMGQKVALIAKNGSGKTAILNIISKKTIPDTGEVVTRRGLTISVLDQKPNLDQNLSIEQCILTSDNKVLRAISNYEKALKNSQESKEYQRAFEQMDQLNAWDFETQYKQILSKLKLDKLNLKVGSLSGGQQKRLSLAMVLLEQPDLLILDEPTNHLDLEMIEWLEDYFAKEKITLLMVTHDRYFLERVCNEIIELDHGELYSYKGNYSYFLEKKQLRIQAQQASVEKAQNLFKKELGWIRRQPKARTTKSKSRISDFQQLKEKAHAVRKEHVVEIELNMERLGSKIIELHHVSKAFEDLIITKDFNYTFKKGERVGIIGKNGTGKSTFLDLITKKIAPQSGKVVVGDTVKIGYYTQSGINPKKEQKVIDIIKEFGEYIPLKKGRTISASQLLERFLFDRKKQYDYIEKLSGGELKRLYLCTVLIQNPNFLILDEPTNDLDIVTLNVLENFLLDYPGCLVIVSHDRYFMDKIVDHLFVFKGSGEIQDFPGNYSDYREYQLDQLVNRSDDFDKKQKKSKQIVPNSDFQTQKKLNKIEREIKRIEDKKAVIEKAFLLGEIVEQQHINEQSKALQNLNDKLEELELKWFEIQEELEN